MSRLPIARATVPQIVPTRVQQSQVGPVNTAAQVRMRPPPIILQPGPALGREQTADRQVNGIQEQARVQSSQASKNPFAFGVMLDNISLLSGSNLVSHYLGKPWIYVLMLSPNQSVTWSVQHQTVAQDAIQLSISVSGNVTCCLWIAG